ncbi:MAG: bifunctional ornithine acetyltransferase/N-acetylglutamate synthase, partial [candidate division KSB1 bacterium]|nr:bifunctional ornithine acetyltransferase/N-acetylglutamate synthase [candidate division KSB1 bacterium]
MLRAAMRRRLDVTAGIARRIGDRFNPLELARNLFDAALSAETIDLLTGVCVKRSFDRISVDGQLSTSDTVFALASGASGGNSSVQLLSPRTAARRDDATARGRRA